MALTETPKPRVSGFRTQRLDAYWPLQACLPGAKVLDIGCNRGLWSIQAALAGARAVHGCDSFQPGIEVACQILADFPGLDVRFLTLDLSRGPGVLAPFDRDYNIVLLLSVIHKLRRQMSSDLLGELLNDIACRTNLYLVCRGNPDDLTILESVVGPLGLILDDAAISDEVQPAVIWRRNGPSG